MANRCLNYKDDERSTAFNLAKLTGMPGRYQLAPLMLWWFAVGSALLLASRQHKVPPVSPQRDNGITNETTEATTELQKDQPAVNYSSQNYATQVGLAALFIFVTAIAVAPVVHYKCASIANMIITGRSFQMTSNQTVTVFGAYGHTGRFVVSELRRRGLTPILSGRDSARLKAMHEVYSEFEIRVASIDDANVT